MVALLALHGHIAKMELEDRLESVDRSQSCFLHQASVEASRISTQQQSSDTPEDAGTRLELCVSDVPITFQLQRQNSIVLLHGKTAEPSSKMYMRNMSKTRRQLRRKRVYMVMVAVLARSYLDFMQDLMQRELPKFLMALFFMRHLGTPVMVGDSLGKISMVSTTIFSE